MRDHRAVSAAEREKAPQGYYQYAGRGGRLTGVYFIESQGFIKIGVSLNVSQRCGGIQNANPRHVEPLAFIPTATFADGERREAELHGLFWRQRHRGEWFKDDPAIRDYIAAHAQPWPIVDTFHDARK